MNDVKAVTKKSRLGANSLLIGQKDARNHLNTPALIVDMDILERNIGHMANHLEKSSLVVRPHAKCHKTLAIAKKQMEAGAIGLCCANLGEAEVMAAGGITDLLITSPLVTHAKIKRLCSLASWNTNLKVVVDNQQNITDLNNAAQASNIELNILVDVDGGMNRTGAANKHSSIALVKLVDAQTHLNYLGLQCYAGHLQHIDNFNDRKKRSNQVMSELADLRDQLITQKLTPEIISGGGTGTFDIDEQSAVLTELQAGSYVFMDNQYNTVWSKNGEVPPFETSLFVQTCVVSANHQGFGTTDAGLKHFAVDGGLPIISKGVPQGSEYAYAGDEFGAVKLRTESDTLSIGTHIECVVPHCDPTVNLYNFIHCFRGDTLVDIWPIDARGA